jgi:hypothetical protein
LWNEAEKSELPPSGFCDMCCRGELAFHLFWEKWSTLI